LAGAFCAKAFFIVFLAASQVVRQVRPHTQSGKPWVGKREIDVTMQRHRGAPIHIEAEPL